jgi:chromosome segregation ATPase
MSAADILSPQTALLIIVGVIGLTFLVLLFLVGRWRTKSNQQLKELRRDLTSRRAACQELTITSQQYDGIDQEPYHSRVQGYRSILSELDQQTASLEGEYQAIQDRIQRGAKDPFRSVVGAPAFWYSVNRDAREISRQLGRGEELIQRAHQTEKSINQLAWEVAGQAREVKGLDQQVKMLLDRLQSRNVHGAALDLAIEQERRSREALRQIPDEFLRAGESDLLEHADREGTALAHSIAADVQPGLADLQERARTWERQYLDAEKLVNRMRRVLASLEGSIEIAPPAIDVREYRQRPVSYTHLTLPTTPYV